MLRFGAPVFDASGELRGAVLVNYFGRRILDGLRSIETGGREGLWLLNSDGFWLLGPSRESEWAFLFRTGKGSPSRAPTPRPGSASARAPARARSRSAAAFTRTCGRARTPHAECPRAIFPTFHLVAYASAAERAAQVAPLRRQSLVTLGAFGTLLAGAALIAIRKAADHSVAEERRRASEARFRAVAENASDGVINADSEGRITYFNAAAERMFGYPAAEVLGRPLTVLMPERFAAAHEAALRRVAAGGERRILGHREGRSRRPPPQRRGVPAGAVARIGDGRAQPRLHRHPPGHHRSATRPSARSATARRGSGRWSRRRPMRW